MSRDNRKKANNLVTENCQETILACEQRDKGKKSLRVNQCTMILVKPENKTPEYAQAYNERINLCRTSKY